MKKIISTTLLALFLSAGLVGCGSSAGKTRLTNDEIIKEVQKCKDSNLDAVASHIWGGPRIFAITCTPKNEKAH